MLNPEQGALYTECKPATNEQVNRYINLWWIIVHYLENQNKD